MISLDVTTRRLSLDPRDPAFYADPSAAYARIHEAGPVWFWEQLGLWCFFGHHDVNRLLRDRRFGREILHLATREELGLPQPAPHTAAFDRLDANSLLEREPPVHTRLRSLISRAFVPRRVESLRPAIEALAHELIDAFPVGADGTAPFDLIESYATPIPVRIIARMLGVPETFAPQLLSWSHDMVAMYGVARDRRVEDRANAAAAAFDAFVRALVAERRIRPGDDLMSVLIEAEQDGERLTEDELVSTVILLLNAGHEATVHALGNAVRLVLQHRVDMPHVVRDAVALERLVEEALRAAPPLHLFKRYVLADTEEQGLALKKGEQIALILGATGYDPQITACPMHFDPQRAPVHHTSFGAGIHFCVGAPLARLELQSALRVLFTRCPQLSLAEVAEPRDSWHFHGVSRLMVVRQ